MLRKASKRHCFFAQIMLNFKKLFSIRIISLVVTFAFLFQSTIYGIDLPKGSNLRVPLMNASGDSTRRLMETLSKVTYHEHVNEHIATQAESQYKSFLQSRDIVLDLAGDVENIAIFYDSLEKYPGSEIAILEIEGLYGNTRVLEHIGLGLFYGRPIIYIDSSLKGQERQEILQHAYDEVTKWEEKRLSLGLEFFQMRQHILDHYEEFEAFADSSHRASHNVDHILEKYKARHKGDLLDAVAMMPFKEGDVVIAAGTLSRRDFGKLMGASLLAYVLAACGVNPDAPTETTPSETVPSEDLSSYMIPGIDLIPDDEAEGYVKERLWSHPENVRALTDASYHFNVPRVLAVSVLGPEIFAMQSGARRSAEDVVSSLHKYDTFSEGIAQLQVRHAVRFFPALYEDATSPGAPLYLRNTVEPYAYLYGSIGDRDDDGALIHFQEIKELLKNDILCIYMMTMYIRESMEILHRADPSFRDPNTFDALSIPTAFEASAIGSYYVYGPAHALNPNATSVWNEVVGSHISTPKYNIYIIRVRQDGWDWLEMDKYLKQSAISMDYSGHSTFSDVMYGMDGWLDSHGSPYDEGLFGVFLDNADLRYAQTLPPQYAYLARMFAHSNVYGFNVPYSYPNNWQAIQAPATPTPISPPTEVPPSFPVGDLPEGFNSDAQGIFYTVQSGDNLWSIATTVYEDMNYLYPDAIDINSVLSIIVSLNDIPDSAVIDIGQKIYVYSFLNSNAGSMRRYSMMPAGLGLAMTRIRAPSVGHVEPVADAYTALQAGKHDEAYDLAMEGLLGEDFVVNIETAIGILRRLLIYYGIDTEKGKTIAAMSPVVAKHKRAVDQTAMKKELAGVISKVRLRGIYRYRLGFTFRMWGQAKRAVYEKFETTAERKEALQHIRILARKLAEKKLDSRDALENAIPAAVRAAENIDAFKLFIELGINLAERGIDSTPSLQRGTTAIAGAAGNREELDLFMDLATTLAENIIDPVATLTHAIPAIAKAANDTEEIRLFIDLGIKLVENGIEPYQVLTSVVPTLASTASNIQELRLFIDLGIKLAENSIDPAPVLEYGIPASAKVAKDIEELGLFIGLGIKLAENAIEPSLALLYAIPATARVASDKDELKLFIDLGATLAENGIDPTLTLQYS
ncbi:MAG: LysM peptidoglycan-binding domain-containing protein, partial [Candidatus Omnitrophica bacterium]|nr:LysM peptidoglycan-binding domain-containing protein [Candidatus Omnitrophota bacterium]